MGPDLLVGTPNTVKRPAAPVLPCNVDGSMHDWSMMLQDLAQLPLLPAQPQPTLEAEEPSRAYLDHIAFFR